MPWHLSKDRLASLQDLFAETMLVRLTWYLSFSSIFIRFSQSSTEKQTNLYKTSARFFFFPATLTFPSFSIFQKLKRDVRVFFVLFLIKLCLADHESSTNTATHTSLHLKKEEIKRNCINWGSYSLCFNDHFHSSLFSDTKAQSACDCSLKKEGKN